MFRDEVLFDDIISNSLNYILEKESQKIQNCNELKQHIIIIDLLNQFLTDDQNIIVEYFKISNGNSVINGWKSKKDGIFRPKNTKIKYLDNQLILSYTNYIGQTHFKNLTPPISFLNQNNFILYFSKTKPNNSQENDNYELKNQTIDRCFIDFTQIKKLKYINDYFNNPSLLKN